MNESLQTEVQNFLEALTEDAIKSKQSYYNLKIATYATYQTLKKKDNTFKKALVLRSIEIANQPIPSDEGERREFTQNTNLFATSKTVVQTILRADFDYSIEDILTIFRVAQNEHKQISYWFPLKYVLNLLEKVVQKNGINPEQIEALQNLQKINLGYGHDKNHFSLKIKEILAKAQGKSLGEIEPVLLDDEDEIGKKINEEIAALEASLKASYYQLFTFFKKATQAKPTQKFHQEVGKLVQTIGTEQFTKTVKNWFLEIKKVNVRIEQHTHTYTYEGYERQYTSTTYEYLRDSTLIFVKGLIWSIEPYADKELMQVLAEYAEKCYKKVPTKGALAQGIGNACIYVLSALGLEGVSYLSRLKLRIRQASTQSLIENYIRESAKKLGVTPAEIEDMATPSFGLENGRLEEEFEGYKAVITVEKIGKANLTWYKPDGTVMKSVPSVVTENHKESLKDLKNDLAEIQKTLTVQRDRLDRSFVQNRTWTWENFDTYYFSHGLMSFIAQKLIWVFEIEGKEIDVFYLNEKWVTIEEKPVEIGKVKSVKLWHPVFRTVQEIRDWREFLAKHEIQQPLKQAYREIYLLTDAEVNTRMYSNRMAAHILKQHQFNALAKIRGWKYSLLGAYDKGYETETAEIQLPENHKAEFWVQELYVDGQWTDSGIYNYVSTDQVRFYRNGTQLAMTDVPPLLFSEAMRDVDLFVGVASVGNDPNWRDGGLQQYRNYWESYSFGDLNEVAKTRKQVLERLIPKMKIAKQCQITDKFLIVKGSLRTYKIHMGSGNILMEPNDQYLCIVPDRKSEDVGAKVFLPFEGDALLSIIISKALLLADDTKIKDDTITSQINRE